MAEPIITVPESDDAQAAQGRAVLAVAARLDAIYGPLVLLLRAADAVHKLLGGWRVGHLVNVVIPDPREDRQPFLLVCIADVDTDKEEVIAQTWPHVEFDFAWIDPEDCP